MERRIASGFLAGRWVSVGVCDRCARSSERHRIRAQAAPQAWFLNMCPSPIAIVLRFGLILSHGGDSTLRWAPLRPPHRRCSAKHPPNEKRFHHEALGKEDRPGGTRRRKPRVSRRCIQTCLRGGLSGRHVSSGRSSMRRARRARLAEFRRPLGPIRVAGSRIAAVLLCTAPPRIVMSRRPRACHVHRRFGGFRLGVRVLPAPWVSTWTNPTACK